VTTSPNARVLACDAATTPAERLGAYLPPDAVAAARAVAETALLAVDAPGEGAVEVARALAAGGAFAHLDGVRLVVAGARPALAAAQAAVAASPAASALARELLRAFDAGRARPTSVRLRDRRLDFAERARVMGILNVTPDSFYDRGKFSGVDRARERAHQMVALGADVIDIGGQSYAHWNPRIAAEEERERVVPVVAALVRDGLDVPLSIDTFKASVAEAALAAGAHLINDCSGLSDPALAGVVARYDAGLVVMHLKGELNVRAASYDYDDAMAEIALFLRERLDAARAAGVTDDALLIDPGLEFGKEPVTDLEILERFGDLRSLGVPILFAASRKSFIGRVFDRPAKELLVPSLATAAIGIAAGAGLIRVHDVEETTQLARMMGAVRPAARERLTIAAAMPGTPAARATAPGPRSTSG
jgi:dihydropteroate synthase